MNTIILFVLGIGGKNDDKGHIAKVLAGEGFQKGHLPAHENWNWSCELSFIDYAVHCSWMFSAPPLIHSLDKIVSS